MRSVMATLAGYPPAQARSNGFAAVVKRLCRARLLRGGEYGAAVSFLLVTIVACTPVPDLAAERMALRKADSLFAVETAERGADGWADYFEASGVMFPRHGRMDGREGIRAFMGPALAPDQPLLRWRTTDVRVGAGGDLGYTMGRWQSVDTTPAGTDTVVSQGHYVTIWRKTADGVWRVAVDIGNSDFVAAATVDP